MISKMNEEKPIRSATRNVKRRILLIGSALALLLTSSFVAGTALATPPSGVTQTPIAFGVLPEPIRVKLKAGDGFAEGTEASDISVVRNTFAPGGYFGWHKHPGPSLVIVTVGALTLYSADDPTCTGQIYPAGSAFLDEGGDTHNVRNETNSTTEVYVLRMLPAGSMPRIDMPDPGVCPF